MHYFWLCKEVLWFGKVYKVGPQIGKEMGTV